MTASLDDDANGGHWVGTISSVSSASSDSSGLPKSNVQIATSTLDPIPVSEVGQNIRVSVQSASTGKPVLAVPIAALFSRPNGRVYVESISKSKETQVPVTAGLIVNGLAEIRPAAGFALTPDERVVVGSNYLG